MDGLHHIGTGAHCMSYINAASNARVHVFDVLQNIQRRMPQLVLGAMIVDGNANVVLLHEFLDAWQGFRRRVPSNDYWNSRPFAVLKLAANIFAFVLCEVDCSGGMERDACGNIVCQRFRLRLRVHG